MMISRAMPLFRHNAVCQASRAKISRAMPFSRLREPRFRGQSRFRGQCRFPGFQGQDFAGNAVFPQRFRAQRLFPGAGFQASQAKISLAMPASRSPGQRFCWQCQVPGLQGKDFAGNGLRLGVKSSGLTVQGSGLRVWRSGLGIESRVQSLEFVVQGLEFKDSAGLRVWGCFVFLAFGCPHLPPTAAPSSSPTQQPPAAAPRSSQPPAAEFRVPGSQSRVQDLKFNGLEFRVQGLGVLRNHC